MTKVIVAVGLVLASVQPSAAQRANPGPERLSAGIAGGPRWYLSGASRRTGAIQLFIRHPVTRLFALEAELAGGGGSDTDIHLPGADDAIPAVVTHFAADLGVNVVFRTPGRVGFLATAGPGLYIEQRDTERRVDGQDTPDVIGRKNDYALGMQASAGVEVAIGSAAVFSVLRAEARAVRAASKRPNLQVLAGVRFPLWF
jgi:hypothetical protein